MNGEIIAILVAVCWTTCSLFFESASNKIGPLNVNLLRLTFGFILLGATLLFMSGNFFPVGADSKAWLLMLLSGFIGMVLGDYFLFASYPLITARYSQLFMTLAPVFTAISSYVLLRETITWVAFLGMFVTLSGIGISVLSKALGGGKAKMSLKGCIYATIGGFGQGLGIVVSKLGMQAYEASYVGDASAMYIPLASTQIRCLAGIFCYVIIILLRGGVKDFITAVSDRRGLAWTFAGSVFGPFLGVTLSLLAVQHSNTSVASTIMATVPVLILVPEYFLLKRKVTVLQVVGAVIAVCGVALFFV